MCLLACYHHCDIHYVLCCRQIWLGGPGDDDRRVNTVSEGSVNGLRVSSPSRQITTTTALDCIRINHTIAPLQSQKHTGYKLDSVMLGRWRAQPKSTEKKLQWTLFSLNVWQTFFSIHQFLRHAAPLLLFPPPPHDISLRPATTMQGRAQPFHLTR